MLPLRSVPLSEEMFRPLWRESWWRMSPCIGLRCELLRAKKPAPVAAPTDRTAAPRHDSNLVVDLMMT